MTKSLFRTIILLAALLLNQQNSYAYDLEVDGLYYNIIGSDKVEVTYKNPDGGSYYGNLQIPEKLTYNNVVYIVTSIGNYAFLNCSGLTGSLTIPNSVTYVGHAAFYGCSGLTGSLTIPNSVTYVDNQAFCGCSGLTGSLTIPNSVTYVGIEAFTNCSGLTGSLVIPKSLTTIKHGVFRGCSSLTSLTIPNSVISIENLAFYDCTGLTGLTIPNSVTSIGSCAFQFCSSLEQVYSQIVTPFSIDNTTFSGISSNAILHIPKGTKDVYNQYTNWICHFANVIDDGENDTPLISTYTLSITAKGNGSASYGGATIRGTTQSFTVNEGTSATITFSPDNGYRIKSLSVNGTAVATSTSYTVTVNSNTTVAVEFEAIPDTPVTPTTYTLSVKATGNGSASYGGETIRGTTRNYTVNSGTSATITFSPDNGYRIKSLKVNGSTVSASTSYTVTINSNTSVEVEFEAIPDTPTITTYTLSIKAIGNGSASYGGTNIRGTTKSFAVYDGTKAAITFTPDDGYQIKSLKVNSTAVTVSESYSVTVNANTSVEVEFEAIPLITYTLSIQAIGNGHVSFNEETIREETKSYTVNEGYEAVLVFIPDIGNLVKTVKVNGSDVEVSGDSYTISNINGDSNVEVTFDEMEKDVEIDGIKYEITSFDDHTLILEADDYGVILEVPDKIDYQGEEWSVIGIAADALENCEDIAAIIWNPAVPFTAKVTNPNVLLYVKDEAYAPSEIKNVVVNGFAKAITLADAQSGNNFYCPEAFIAQSIVYTHNYYMKTGFNESGGWETLTLPFDVQQISHSSKGEIVPFTNWTSGSYAKPFWLYEMSGNGFVEAEAIKANTPYIISMPNNEMYPNEYQLTGRVIFSAENATVESSDDMQTSTSGNRTLVPNYLCRDADSDIYALNVSNDYEYYRGAENEGSMFILNLRKIHPFEAFMTSTSGTRTINVFDGTTTAIRGLEEMVSSQGSIKVYDLSGRLIKTATNMETIKQELPIGVYIVNNKKIIIK